MRKVLLNFFVVSFTFFLAGNSKGQQPVYPCGTYYISLNGTSDYGLFSNTYSATEFTLAAWIQLRDSVWAGKEMDIFQRQYNGYTPYEGVDGLDFYISADGILKFKVYISKDGGGSVLDSVSSGTRIEPFRWYHVAVSFAANGNCNLYVNGNNAGSASFGKPRTLVYPYLDFLSIGSKYSIIGINDYHIKTYKGWMDELVCSSIALTQEQIMKLANGIPAGDTLIKAYKIMSYDKLDNYPGGVNSGIGGGQVGVVGQLYRCNNKPPVANAGSDRTITLPSNSVTLDGSSSTDPDGTIVKYQWIKLSGPSSGGGTISSSQAAITSATGLNEGTYVFRLTVTDNNGATNSDDVQIIVSTGNKYITIANLRVYADNIPPPNTNPRIVSGNVHIVPKNGCGDPAKVLFLSGSIAVDSVNNVIKGNGTIYFSGISGYNNLSISPENYTLNIVDNVITWDLNVLDAVSTIFSFFNFEFKVSSIRVLCDGLHLKAKMGLPKWVYLVNELDKFSKNRVSVDSIFLTYKGVDFKGGIEVNQLTFNDIFGIKKLSLNYNSLNHSFDGSLRIQSRLFNIDGSTKWINGGIDELKLGVASDVGNYIPLPGFPTFGIDSAGGGIGGLQVPPPKLSAGIRISPASGIAIPSLANVVLTGEYAFGTKFTGEARFSFFSKRIYGASITYSPQLFEVKGDADLDFKLVKLRGSAKFSVNSNDVSAKLKGTSKLSLQVPKFEDKWLKYLNKLYPEGEYLSSSNYFDNNYLAGTAKIPLLPRLFYIVKYSSNGWQGDYSTSSKIIPLEAQSELQFRKLQTGRVADKAPLVYSFTLNSQTENMIVQATASQPPLLSLYLVNGDTITPNNYQKFNNVLFIADPSVGISTYIISKPLLGIYYLWSSNADSIRVVKINQRPKVIITGITDNKSSKKLSINYRATDPDDDAQILFGFDRDKSNANGIILRDSVSENSSTGTITLDYSKINSGVYYLYASITDSIGQNEYFYYDSPFKIVASSAPNAPSNLSVQTTDTSLIFRFAKNNQVSCNYLIHYNDDKDALDLNSYNFAIGDTNFIELTNLPAGKSYQFAVAAIDSNMNESDLSNIVAISWKSSKINNAPTFKTGTILSKVKAGENYSSSVSAVDPDGDGLIYSLIKGPSDAKIDGAGIVSWTSNNSNVGYNELCVKVTDNRGGADSLCFELLVYNSLIAAPNVAFNKTAFDSYSEKPLIEVTDLLADKSDSINVKVFSSSDPLGIMIAAKRIGDQTSSFVSEIGLSNNTGTANSVKVLKGDTLWVEYSTADSRTALNYSLFNYLKADFLFKDSACSSDAIRFYNASKGSNLKYEWDFGDNNFSNETNPNHVFSIQNGKNKYTVKLKITNAQNTTDTISKTITLKYGFASIVTTDKTNLCIGDSVILSSSSPLNNQWYRNDTLIAGATQANFNVKQSGNYSVHVSQTGCSAISSPVAVTVAPIPQTPTISVSGQLNFCIGDSITLTSSSTLGNQWYKDGNPILGATNNNYVIKTTGSYTVKTIANGCSSVSSGAVVPTILQLPTGSITTASATICPGSNTQLTASGGNTYQWYKDAQQIAGANASNYTATTSGVYTADIVSSNGCKTKASNSVTVTALNKPKAAFSIDSYCLNLPVSFTNTTSGSNVSYQWNFGDNQTSASISPQHSYSKIGSYTVSLVASLKDCSNSNDTLQKIIKIEAPLPGIKYPLVSAAYGIPQQLSARDIGKAYQWIPPTDLNNARSRTPLLTPTGDRKYAIRITTSSGCITTDSLEIAFLKDIKVLVPTAFAPNGNGSNDVLRPVLLNIASIKYFRIYNRWGQLLYETKTINEGWNGNYQGRPQPMETYTWVFEGTDIKGNPVKASGKSVLLR